MIINTILLILLLLCVFIGFGLPFGGLPFLPTRRQWIEDALRIAAVGPGDVVVDLGSGNGIVLKLALARGVKKAVGYEVNPVLVFLSRLKLAKYRDKAKVVAGNLFHSDLPSDTTVVYLFGIARTIPKFEEYIVSQRRHLNAKKVKVICFGCQLNNYQPVVTSEAGGVAVYEI